MVFNCEELSILETLTLNKIVNIRCKKLELKMNKELMDEKEYEKNEISLKSQLDEMTILHDKILKLMEE